MWLALQSNEVNTLFRHTGREDVLHSGVRGEHLTHELLLLLPEVVLQVIRQHHISGLFHGHHLAEHLQLDTHRRQTEIRESDWTAKNIKKKQKKTGKSRCLLHISCVSSIARIQPALILVSMCLFKRFVSVPGGGKEWALLYFWFATMCPCQASPPLFQSCKPRHAHKHKRAHRI